MLTVISEIPPINAIVFDDVSNLAYIKLGVKHKGTETERLYGNINLWTIIHLQQIGICQIRVNIIININQATVRSSIMKLII